MRNSVRFLVFNLLLGCSILSFASTQERFVKMNWLSAEDMERVCVELSKTHNTPIQDGETIASCSTIAEEDDGIVVSIFAQEPNSFGDGVKLQALGHEILESLSFLFYKNSFNATRRDLLRLPIKTKYSTTSQSRWFKKKVRINYLAESQTMCDRIAFKSGFALQSGITACAVTLPSSPEICDIFTEKPKNRNDKVRIETLGHELWHCFGAVHD